MKKYTPTNLLLSFSIFFLPSFFTSSAPIQIEPYIISHISMYRITQDPINQEISGSASYKIVTQEELDQIEREKYKDIPAPSDQQLNIWFDQYASQFGVSSDLLKKIAYCESHFNPKAVNGPYGGMYQYSSSTWISTREAMGEGSDASLRFNAQESIKTSAFKITSGGIGAWPHCGK